MTVAWQGDLTLQLNNPASWHLPAAAAAGLGQPLASSGTAEIAPCDSIPWSGLTALPRVGRIPAERPFEQASIASRRLRHGGRAEMRVLTTQPLYPSVVSPSLWRRNASA
jgi:hypothetical protein